MGEGLILFATIAALHTVGRKIDFFGSVVWSETKLKVNFSILAIEFKIKEEKINTFLK
jgi:hypothetical protein